MAKVQFGVSDLVVFERTEGESAITYSNPLEVKGIVNVKFDPNGESNVFYADNVRFWVGNTNQGYEGSLEIALIPDEFKKLYLGYEEATNGNLVETDKSGKSFGMVFKFKTDTEDRYAVLYNCTVARPSEEHSTIEESAEPQTSELSLTVSGDVVGNRVVYKAEVHPEDSNYATIKTAFALPTFE